MLTDIESIEISQVKTTLESLSLDELAGLQHTLEARQKKEWRITGLILSEARSRFRANQEFGRWCDAQKFSLSRSALRRYRIAAEFVVHHGEQRLPNDQQSIECIAYLPVEQQAQVLERIASGEADAGKRSWLIRNGYFGNKNKSGKKRGDAAITKAAEEAENAMSNITSSDDKSALQKAIDAELKRLRAIFAQEVEQAINERIKPLRERLIQDEALARQEKIKYERMVKRVSHIMTYDEFKLVRGCLHPDRARDDIERAKMTKAFEIFNRLETKVNPDAPIAEPRRPGWDVSESDRSPQKGHYQ